MEQALSDVQETKQHAMRLAQSNRTLARATVSQLYTESHLLDSDGV